MNQLAQKNTTKHIYLLFLALSLCLFSCKKDNKEASPTIVGKWSVKSYVITSLENGGVDIDKAKDILPRPTFEFKSDGSFIINRGGTSTKGETFYYTVTGNQLTFNEEIVFDHKDFTFNISGSRLVLKRTQTYKASLVPYTENTTVTLDKL
ncbi:MAG: hypothetical protein P0Y49_21770 [Candidatus Pedobacter colombiensis]|uniref:Lipocalin-like domain-containing protein n=1 Tax=Candidatus Pedobacter colombiensis TaxID=3121371 RepID=A0AAJ5W940_9SPHI|nr:hypothetical protein [Pedobacter sp.]WEK19406.1 MAG: hypothetical protein P0Y49_21770 [Pedobacter sp.]